MRQGFTVEDFEEQQEFEKGSVLAESLAATLRVSRDRLICYTEMTCPGGRMDVWAMKSSWADRDLRCYEVKVSRADYWNDVNSGKYEKYLPYCKRFYFAVPSGLVKKAEVPEGCGLITKGPNGWRTIIPAVPHEATGVTMDFVLDLVREVHYRERYSPQRILKERVIAAENHRNGAYIRNLGDEIARKASAYDRGQSARSEDEESADLHRKQEALELLEAVEDLAAEAGVEIGDPMRFDTVTRRAEFAVAMIRHANAIREIGGILTRLPYKTAEDIQSVLR